MPSPTFSSGDGPPIDIKPIKNPHCTAIVSYRHTHTHTSTHIHTYPPTTGGDLGRTEGRFSKI